ncbi:tetratricopeptide repeat protein, partial [Nonomuraea sp. NPDC046802]|uniref:tetratricopeptide repeat protein n=1 Tax=Nonomuraea sp. NPDC046802 TaxID=3154919 RepID=UPI0033EB8512
HESVLSIRERILGPEHPDYLISLNNLARTYEHAELYSKAIQTYTRLVAGSERVYGADDRRTLVSRNSLEELLGN